MFGARRLACDRGKTSPCHGGTQRASRHRRTGNLPFRCDRAHAARTSLDERPLSIEPVSSTLVIKNANSRSLSVSPSISTSRSRDVRASSQLTTRPFRSARARGDHDETDGYSRAAMFHPRCADAREPRPTLRATSRQRLKIATILPRTRFIDGPSSRRRSRSQHPTRHGAHAHRAHRLRGASRSSVRNATGEAATIPNIRHIGVPGAEHLCGAIGKFRGFTRGRRPSIRACRPKNAFRTSHSESADRPRRRFAWRRVARD